MSFGIESQKYRRVELFLSVDAIAALMFPAHPCQENISSA